MQTRTFKYGGLEVNLVQSPQYGWVTTTPELAKACGVDSDTLAVVIKKYDLVRKGSVVEDQELTENFRLIRHGRGRPPKTFWTVEGMTFVAMFMRTERCEQFREEVLKTIKELEQQGYINLKQVMESILALQEMVVHLTQKMAILEAENAQLRASVTEMSQVQASSAGFNLVSQKKTRHLRAL